MKIAAYCRVSTARITQLESLSNQKEFFVGYAKANNHELISIYADEGISGKQMKNRTEFLRMLEDAKEGKFEAIVVKDISRFSRNTLDFLIAIRSLKSMGVDVIFLSNNMSVLGNGELFLTMHSAIAQEESLNLSKRIKFGKKVNAQKGRVPTSIFGYDRVDNFNLKINEQEAEVVKKIFNLYTKSGYSKNEIARFLNDNGYKTKRLSNFSAKTVSRIMSNPIYCGVLENNKYKTVDYINGKVEIAKKSDWFYHKRPELKIISKKQFETANKLTNIDYNNKISCEAKTLNTIFRGKIFCKSCGGSFIKRSYKYKNLHIKYVCSSHHKGVGCRNNISFDLYEFLSYIRDYVNMNAGSLFCEKKKVTKAILGEFNGYLMLDNRYNCNILDKMGLLKVFEGYCSYLSKNYYKLAHENKNETEAILCLLNSAVNLDNCCSNAIYSDIENYIIENKKSITVELNFLFLLYFARDNIQKVIISDNGEVEILFNF